VVPRFAISGDLGMDISSWKMVSRDGPKLGPHGDPRVKVTGPSVSSGRGSTPFARPLPTHSVALAPAAPIEGDASVIFSYTGANPSS
jgi:hypothetical protein